MRLSAIVVMLSCLTLIPATACGDPFRGPWDSDKTKPTGQKQKNHLLNPLYHLVNFYKEFISPVDGPKCPMYPTCAAYSIKCFEKHGLIMGYLMTIDRLLHEADEMNRASLLKVHGKWRYHDPVENNDFWWYKPSDYKK